MTTKEDRKRRFRNMALDYTFERQIMLEREAGFKEGFAEGFVETYTEIIDELILELNEAGRLEDLVKAATDKKFWRKLFEEFDI